MAHTHPLAHVPLPGSSRQYSACFAKDILMALARGCFWLLPKLGDSAECLHSEELWMLEGNYFSIIRLNSWWTKHHLTIYLCSGKELRPGKNESMWNSKLDFNLGLCAMRPALHWYVIQKLLQKIHVNYTLPHFESQAAKTCCSKHPCSHELQPLFTSIQREKKKKKKTSTLI